MIAPVNKIIAQSTVDGPGNRTAIFLQGCDLSCGYCHNPETQNLCNACGLCIEECPTGALHLEERVYWNRELCQQCDHCIQMCPNLTSPKVENMTPGQVLEQVKKNMPFIRGITVSGGECMLYPEFLTELFWGAKKWKLSCYIDSNGCTDFSNYPQLLQLCDKIMLDVKAWDSKQFFSLTGGKNEIVKKNLVFLAECNQLEEVRIVCQETMVDVEAIIYGIAEMVGKNIKNFTLKLIRFRNQGVKGSLKGTATPTLEQMEIWKKIAFQQGFLNIHIV